MAIYSQTYPMQTNIQYWMGIQCNILPTESFHISFFLLSPPFCTVSDIYRLNKVLSVEVRVLAHKGNLLGQKKREYCPITHSTEAQFIYSG